MPCTQSLAGIARDCAANVGGVKAVYMANFEDVVGVAVTTDVVSGITLGTGKKFYTYNFNPNTSSYTTNVQANRENGTLYFETVLSLVFPKQDAAKRLEVNALAQAGLMAIVQDNNDNYWLLGKDEPLLMTSGTAETGTARADRNGYALEFTDGQKQMPYTVDPAIISDLIA